jgi:hypothetical protein
MDNRSTTTLASKKEVDGSEKSCVAAYLSVG